MIRHEQVVDVESPTIDKIDNKYDDDTDKGSIVFSDIENDTVSWFENEYGPKDLSSAELSHHLNGNNTTGLNYDWFDNNDIEFRSEFAKELSQGSSVIKDNCNQCRSKAEEIKKLKQHIKSQDEALQKSVKTIKSVESTKKHLRMTLKKKDTEISELKQTLTSPNKGTHDTVSDMKLDRLNRKVDEVSDEIRRGPTWHDLTMAKVEILASIKKSNKKVQLPDDPVCDVCGESFKTEHDLKGHKQRLHCEVNCLICNHLFYSLDELQRHEEFCSGRVEPVKCDICTKDFINEPALSEHKKLCKSGKKKYACPLCGLMDHSEDKLEEHMKICKGETPPPAVNNYKCNDCSFTTPDLTSLDEHIDSEHERPNHILTLFVGDSHLKNINHRRVEMATKGQLFVPGYTNRKKGEAGSRTYCSTADWPNARYPEQNLTDTLPQLLSARQYTNLIVLAPCNDITNLRTMSQSESLTMAVKSSHNTIAAVEKALTENTNLKDVTIIERFPRVDELSEVSEFSNFVLRVLAEKSPFRNKIYVGNHSHIFNNIPEKEEKMFGPYSSRYSDGIHYMGNLGNEVISDSIRKIIRTSKQFNASDSWKVARGGRPSDRMEAQPTDAITSDNRFSLLN